MGLDHTHSIHRSRRNRVHDPLGRALSWLLPAQNLRGDGPAIGRGRQAEPKMSDTRFTVPSTTESCAYYDVSITADRDGGYLPNLAESAVPVEQAALARSARVVSAHSNSVIVISDSSLVSVGSTGL
jgi:hypothetical protein